MNRVRIYGKTLNEWHCWGHEDRELLVQKEIEYKEYDPETGELVGVGSEDFSLKRLKSIKQHWIWTWDGQKRNKGGYRWFECQGLIKYRDSDWKDLKQLMAVRYPSAEVIEYR